jgi:hypothetical protein
MELQRLTGTRIPRQMVNRTLGRPYSPVQQSKRHLTMREQEGMNRIR